LSQPKCERQKRALREKERSALKANNDRGA